MTDREGKREPGDSSIHSGRCHAEDINILCRESRDEGVSITPLWLQEPMGGVPAVRPHGGPLATMSPGLM